MALTPKGKRVKELVLTNLAVYADAKFKAAKLQLENEFNNHATEQSDKNIKIGSSNEIREKYDPRISELLTWKRYKDILEDLS